MEGKKRYLLKGDISGIQEFIFNVQSKGASKALKARSYYVQILGKLAYDFILKNLDNTKKFYEGGGSFFIEFSATDDSTAENNVAALRKIVNDSQRHEDLLIHLSFVKINDDNFWSQLRNYSNKEKLQFFEDNNNFFEPYLRKNDVNNQKFPQVENWISKTSNPHDDSNQFKALTEIMVKEEKVLVNLLDGTFSETEANFENLLINKLPFWKDYGEKQIYENYRKGYSEAYTDNNDLKGKNIVDFDALGDFAAHRTGTNKIGILKLDVDNLGELFGTADYDMVKQYSETFSKFFTETIYTSLYNSKYFQLGDSNEEPYKANVYPIFAGGDDCFIIGGWDAILCFANDLHALFETDNRIKEITLNGKPMTFSAGIVLVNPTHPVRNFSELAEEALKKAKSTGKNRISIFDLSFTWDEYCHVLKTSKLLADEMQANNISRAYLDKIRKSAKGFNALQNGTGADFDRIYKLKYYLSKNDEKLGSIVKTLFEPYYEALSNRLLGKEGSKYDVAIYPTITRITEFLTKTKLNYVTELERIL